MRPAVLTAAAIAVLGSGAITAQPPPQTQPPVFRGSVQSIQVDVRVTDQNGRAVRNLRREDFTLIEDNVPQAITSASFVDLEVESPVTPMSPDAIDSDVATNAGVGRMWVILLGDFGGRARDAARIFVQESLGPNDQVAIINVHGTMSRAQAFTRNRTLMLEAIDRLGEEPDNPGVDTTRIAYNVLEDVCNRLGRVAGRKAVLFFDPPRFFGSSGPAGSVGLGAPINNDTGHHFDQRDALAAATRNNVAIYVVSTAGISGMDLDRPIGAEKLTETAGQRLLAEETGGDAIVGTNNYLEGYERFVRDSNQYYLLGYTPRVEHRDGEFHRVVVRVNRPGLIVRARGGYYAPPRESRRTRAPEPLLDAPKRLSPAAVEALRMPLSVSGLTVTLFAAPFRSGGRNAAVLVGAQVEGASLQLRRGETIEVGFVGTTTEGKTSPGSFHLVRLDLTDMSRRAVERSGLPFVDRLQLAPGRHQVKFVAHQPGGRTGMVVLDVDVPNFTRAPVSVSGIVLGADLELPQTVLKRDESMMKVMAGAYPTARRSFSVAERLTVYVEAYTTGKTRLAETVASISRVGRPGRREPALTPIITEPQRVAYRRVFPLKDFEPGDYVLTVEARAGKDTAARQVPFTVRR